MGERTYRGGCHCGAVAFEVDYDPARGVSRCNCSICNKLGRAGAIVKPAAFRLLRGEDALTAYRWGAGIGEHLFCKTCGVHSFGRGHLEQIGGDYVSINFQCVEEVDVVAGDLPITYWDGRHDNWMAGARDRPWPITG